MTEYTVTVPTAVGYKVADHLYKLCELAGGSTLVVGVGSWFAPDGQRINENVGQHTHIVDEHSPNGQLFVCALNKLVAAMHEHGEHTVLVRRLSGRGLVHFFLTKGQEVPLR